MFSKISIPTIPLILLVTLLILIIGLSLMLAQNYFNAVEIKLLAEKATEQNLEYHLVIHNQFTNSYDFHIMASNER